MEREAHRRDRALDRYWDAVLRQDTDEVRSGDVEPDDAAMIERVQALGPATPLFPDPARAWRELIQGPVPLNLEDVKTGASEGSTAPLGSALQQPNGRVPGDLFAQTGARPAVQLPSGRLRWAVPPLASVFIVLLILLIGYFTLGPRLIAPEPPSMLSALIASPEPQATTNVVATTLVDIAIPAASMPGGEVQGSALAHQTILPGTTSTWDKPALLVDHVLAGTYSVRSDGPTQVVRAGSDGLPEAVEAGEEITMRPGDAMISWGDTATTYYNPGSSPVEVVSWNLDAGTDSSDPTPVGWVTHDVDLRPGLTIPPGSTRVHLQQIELPPDASFPAAPDTLQMSVTLPTNASGTPNANSAGNQRDGTVLNVGSEPITVYVMTMAVPKPQEPATPGSTVEP